MFILSPLPTIPAVKNFPVWAESSLYALSEYGMSLDPNAALTRSDAAQLLYQTVQLKNRSIFAQ